MLTPSEGGTSALTDPTKRQNEGKDVVTSIKQIECTKWEEILGTMGIEKGRQVAVHLLRMSAPVPF